MDNDKIYELFGRRVADARHSARLTQSELSNRVRLSRASIANIEAGRQRIALDQAIEIAQALNLRSLADLLPNDLSNSMQVHQAVQNIKTTGSEISASEAETIARIVASSQ